MKPSDPYTNYSTPASLGYKDPDAEEAQQRTQTGTPGAWTVVSKTEEKEEEKEGDKGEEQRGEKRCADEDEDVRAFKLRRKTASVGLGEIFEPGRVDEPSRPALIVEPSLFRKRKGRPTCS